MASPIQLSNEDVKLLRDHQLVRLLYQLLYVELRTHGINQYDSQVPLSVYIKDGGIDGIARWSVGQPSTAWLPSRFVGFQAKAADMDARACGKEVLAADGTLKPQVQRLVMASGSYILFLARDCVEQSKQPRIEAIQNEIRTAMTTAGQPLGGLPDVRIYDASDIAAWANLYPAVVAHVFECLGRAGAGAMSWGELNGSASFQIPFETSDPKRVAAMAALDDAPLAPRDVVRVLGSSGMGKSRLVLEAFRPPTDAASNPSQASRSNQFCYLNAARAAEVLPIIQAWRRGGCAGIVVVDDCPQELHEQITDEVRRSDSRLSLITIGSDIDPTAYAGTDTRVLLLEPAADELILDILKGAFAEIDEADRLICTELAQGYPLMAIRVAEARKGDTHLTARLTGPVLAKLLGRPVPQGSAAEKVIAACALFESVGVEGDKATEREFVRSTFCPEVSANDFYREVVDFERSGAVTRYGRVVQVRPAPLAIRLAADWWGRCSPERAAQIVGMEFPAQLAESFCSRLRMLDFVPSLVELCEQFCGPQGPFGQAKVLSSELGSRLFRAIVEVNPVAGTHALNTAFAGWDATQLHELRNQARRNIVWALERLVFRAQTFSTAVEFLGRLAAAENETWSNNATGTLTRLFMIFLPGTEVSLSVRVEALLRMSHSTDPALRRVAVSAFDKALKSGHFTGTVGAESQGSGVPLVQYRPKAWKEVFDYWAACLQELCRLVEEDGELGESAASVVANHIRGLVGSGRLDDLEKALVRIAKARQVVWTRAIDAIRDALRYEGAKATPEVRARLNQWLEILAPTDIVQRLRLVVTEAPFEHEERNSGDWVDVASERALDLGLQCAGDWEPVVPLIKSLLSGRQQQAFSFGKGLAKGSGQSAILFAQITALFAQVPAEDQNPALIGGWLSSLDESEPTSCDDLLNVMAASEQLRGVLPLVMRGIKLTDKRLRLIQQLLETRVIEPRRLIGLSYGQAMQQVSVETVSSLRAALATFGTEGAWVALDILFMYAYGDVAKAEALNADFKAILLQPHMLSDDSAKREMHAFETVAKRLIADDPLLAASLMAELLRVLLADVEHDWRSTEQLIMDLLSDQIDACWPLIKEALLSDKGGSVGHWNLTECLGKRLRDTDTMPLAVVPLSYLVEWCEENPNRVPALLAGMVPTLSKDGEEWRISDAVRMLLDRYGDQSSVTASIGASLNSFSWTGSLVPFYDRLISVIEPLMKHPRDKVRQWAYALTSEAGARRERERLSDAEVQAGRI